MSRARGLAWAGAGALLVGALVWAAWPSGGPATTGQRAHALATELRCPDCEGLSVADSSTPSAQAIRADLTRRTNAGQSDASIRSVYVARYGPSILLNPPTSGLSLLVWVLPVVALALGAGGLAFAFRRWRRQPRLIATDADEALVRGARRA
jgi:cytochrome c-type biogenesis protein CcmH